MTKPKHNDDLINGFDTKAIHAGQHFDPTTNAVITPIYATSTYAQETPGVAKFSVYARVANPTRSAFERAVAALESGTAAFAYASGQAAEATVLELLEHGSHIIATDDIYGGSYRLFEQVKKQSSNLSVTYIDMSKPENLLAAIKPNTKMVWIESPTNPVLKLVDIAAVAKLAKERGLLTVADNTFASPWIQRPLELGVDIVIHSATKYINGHSDVIGGLAVVANDELAKRLAFLHKSVGAIASPFDSFLMHRGIKTLGIRMQRHCENALTLARWLDKHPGIEKVYYPGLPSHPQHELAKRQMKNGFGGIISAIIKGGLPRATEFLKAVRIFTLAESLGGVESLIEHPALMTHASMPADLRKQLGFDDGFVRLSVGIEDVNDLQADLAQALA